MADDRTQEQREANAALADAIRRTHDAYWDANATIVTQYMVVGARSGVDDQGDEITSTFTLFSNPAPPPHQRLGLAEWAAQMERSSIGTCGC